MGIRQKEGYPPFLNRENYVYPTNEGKTEPGGLLSFTGGTIPPDERNVQYQH